MIVALLRDARADLKHAVRLFARQPAILLLTILGLSLGLGIATAAFSIMNAALLGRVTRDPIALAGASLILLAMAILAVLGPTRRAAAVDAAVVLRQS